MARIILGSIGGGIAGFAWQRIVGCRTGTCPLTSKSLHQHALRGVDGADAVLEVTL